MISEGLLNQIREIENVIRQLDKDTESSNAYCLNSMKAHAEEVSQLFQEYDAHYKDETIDMLIHCLLLLNRAACSKDEINCILDRRVKRFIERIFDKCPEC